MENDDSFTKKINLFRKLSFYLVMRTFKSEIDEEMRLDMKYNLSRTKDEMEKVKLFINKRRILQDRYKYYNMKSSYAPMCNGIRNLWSWMRKNYFSFRVRDTLDENNYAKYMKRVNMPLKLELFIFLLSKYA